VSSNSIQQRYLFQTFSESDRDQKLYKNRDTNDFSLHGLRKKNRSCHSIRKKLTAFSLSLKLEEWNFSQIQRPRALTVDANYFSLYGPRWKNSSCHRIQDKIDPFSTLQRIKVQGIKNHTKIGTRTIFRSMALDEKTVRVIKNHTKMIPVSKIQWIKVKVLKWRVSNSLQKRDTNDFSLYGPRWKNRSCHQIRYQIDPFSNFQRIKSEGDQIR